MKILVARALLLWLSLCATGVSQTRSSAPGSSRVGHKLIALKVSGTTTYTDGEILAASGLQLGQDAAEAEFKEAAQHLVNSGMFADVVYSFSYSDNGVHVDFKLTDIDKSKLIPARFDNFVWFTDADLISAIDGSVPLFKQLLPAQGQLSDQVAQALQTLLAKKQLPGRVSFIREANDQNGGNLSDIFYRVDEVTMPIRRVEFPGASPDQAASLSSAQSRLGGAEYSRSSIAAVARLDLLPVLLERGYLKAQFDLSSAHVIPRGENQPSEEVDVDVLIPVAAGKQYRISTVTWLGTSAVSTKDAEGLFHLTAGEPADAVALSRDIEALTKVYHARGYMAAQIQPDPQFDDEKATVHFDMHVTEGDLYKMGDLEIVGIDVGSRDRLREAWTLAQGQPYNADYTRKFLADASRFFPRGAQYSVKLDESLDSKDKLVDVTIQYKLR